MIDRLCALTAVTAALATGCGVQRLPPVSAPAKVVPADVDVPPEPPAAGTGRVILETNGEPAKVIEITGAATASSGRYSATVIGTRPLCTTPCVVDLTYGSHPILLRSVADATHQSEADLEVGARAKVFRHTLGERTDGGALRVAGGALATLGFVAALTGATLWMIGGLSSKAPDGSGDKGASLASTGQLVTGLGVGGILLSIPFFIAGRPTERAGATTQWSLPGTSPSEPTSPRAPAGAAVDRL
jgi:hypothetical protein